MKHLAALSLLGLLAPPLAHAEVRSEETVLIPRDADIPDNLYATGQRVLIHGVIRGDLVVLGGTVVIDGEVRGDVLAVAAQLNITGVVGGDVRAAGGKLELLGPVAGDLLVAGGDIRVDASVAGDAIVTGGALKVSGDLYRRLDLTGDEVRLDARVAGPVEARASRMTLGADARLGGALSFAGAALDIVEGAVVHGELTEELALAGRYLPRVAASLRLIVGFFLLGLIWFVLFRRFVGKTSAILRAHPGYCAGVGAGLLFGAPFAFAAVVGVGGLIGGWWLGLVGAGALSLALALTVPLAAFFVGDLLLSRWRFFRAERAWRSMLPAMVALLLVIQVPIVGLVVGLAVSVLGLGAITIALMTTLKYTRNAYDAREAALG